MQSAGPWLSALALALALVSGTSGCGEEHAPWPPELKGHYATNAPGYEGRYFELSPTMLTIETEVGGLLVQNVERLEMAETPRGEPIYVVHYRGRDGSALTFQIMKRAKDFSRIQLLNRNQMWERVPGKSGA